MKGEGNHQYGLKGEKNSSWNSDRRLSRYGYIQVRVIDHPFRDKADFVFEHRLIAEKYLLNEENPIVIDGKRCLKKDYVVHHKDFDRLNNDIENLVVMLNSEHQSYHAKLNSREKDEKGRFMKNKELIKLKRVTNTALMPERKSIGAAGYDLYVDSAEPVVVKAHETAMLSSGVAMVIPKNYFGAIYARSGLATKMGLRPATCVSVIDSDYRGCIGIPIHNDTDEDKVIEPHERVAQIVFQKALNVDFELVESFDKTEETERGNNGFGSTGV